MTKGPLAGRQGTAARFLLRHLIVGAIAGLLFGALLLGVDAFGLRRLVLGAAAPALVLALLAFGLVVTFGSAAMGIAVMGLGDDRDR